MTPILVTPPTVEPITLAQAKDHLRVVVPEEDAYITSLIIVARSTLEGVIHRSISPQRLAIGADAFYPQRGLPRFPAAPTPNVVVTYYDQDGAQQTLPDTDYFLDPYVEPPQLHLLPGITAPRTQVRAGAVRVEYDAGYADLDATQEELAAAVPAPLKQWMLLAIGAFYEHREAVTAQVQTYELPEDFMCYLLQDYMVYE